MSKTAFQTFSLENDILQIPPQDEIYRFDSDANKEINKEAPWTKELSPCFHHIGLAFLEIAQSSLLQDMQNLSRRPYQNGLADLTRNVAQGLTFGPPGYSCSVRRPV